MDETSRANSNRLISALVQERSLVKNAESKPNSTPKLRQQHHQLAKLATEPIYLLKLTVKVGVQSLRLDGSHLGIQDNVMRLLEAKAIGGYAAKISKRLLDAANKLQARQKIIYSRYTVLSEPFRFVHESSLPKVLEAIEQMQAEADQLRTEILEGYQLEYTNFLEWAASVLTEAALEAVALESALRKYASAYPTKEDLQQNCLRVLVEGPVKVPSLLEESQRQEAELAHVAEKHQVADEREKLKLLARAQETLQQTLVSTLYDAQTRSKDEAHGKLASLLESFTLSRADTTERTQQKWDTLISRLEVLAQYDPSLEPIVTSAATIQQLYLADTPDLDAVQKLLEDFRAMLKERLKQDPVGSGAVVLTKALAFDSNYSDLLKQLDALALCPDPEQLHQLQGQLASLDSLFKFRSKDLQKRWATAENAVRQSLGVAHLTQPSVQAKDESKLAATVPEPYDPDAGF